MAGQRPGRGFDALGRGIFLAAEGRRQAKYQAAKTQSRDGHAHNRSQKASTGQRPFWHRTIHPGREGACTIITDPGARDRGLPGPHRLRSYYLPAPAAKRAQSFIDDQNRKDPQTD